MTRTQTRQLAFELLYSLEIQKDSKKEEQVALFLKEQEIKDEQAKKYILNIVKGIEENKTEIIDYRINNKRGKEQ